MANIADNLKRLLGTEGHNIQEVLENADSIGGGSSNIPTIEFVNGDSTGETFDNFVIGEVRGIDDASKYTGPCFIKLSGVSSSELQPSGSVLILGTATLVEALPGKGENDPVRYATVYGAPYMLPTAIMYLTFSVITGDDSVQFNRFALGTMTSPSGDGQLNPGNQGSTA